MKFLEAKDGEPRDSITPKDVENKMRKGTRSDQKMDSSRPETLISGSQGSRAAQRGDNTPKSTSTATPSAEVTNLATELKVDVSGIKGTGPNGTITENDVREAHKAQAQIRQSR